MKPREKLHPDALDCLVLIFKPDVARGLAHSHVSYLREWAEIESCEPVKLDSSSATVRRMWLLRCRRVSIPDEGPLVSCLVTRLKDHPLISDCYVHERGLSSQSFSNSKPKKRAGK